MFGLYTYDGPNYVAVYQRTTKRFIEGRLPGPCRYAEFHAVREYRKTPPPPAIAGEYVSLDGRLVRGVGVRA